MRKERKISCPAIVSILYVVDQTAWEASLTARQDEVAVITTLPIAVKRISLLLCPSHSSRNTIPNGFYTQD